MKAKELSLIVALIQVMWADNEIAEGEREMLGGVLAKLGCDPEEIFAVGELIKNPVNAQDFMANLPDMEDRREIIQAMAVMAMADGNFADAEMQVIHKAAAHLSIPASEVDELIEKGCQLVKKQN
ncbi:MAG: TerB family tellurite resistance protein [bacterium]|nr:TerB family tellurite resistance protein [bacterium]